MSQQTVRAGSVTLRQSTSTSVGGRLTLWVGGRWGVEQTVSYSPSWTRWAEHPGYPLTFDTAAHVLAVSARVTFRLTAPSAPLTSYLAVGPSFVWYGGPAYDRIDAKGVGGVIGAGVTVPLGRLPLSVQIDAEDDVVRSWLRLRCAEGVGPCGTLPQGAATPARVQNNLSLSLGVALTSPGIKW